MALRVFLFALMFGTAALYGGTPDPEIQKIVSEISSDRIAATMKKLESFGTRGNFTDPKQEGRGIGAARRWIRAEFEGYSPRLQVSFNSWNVKKKGRILRDVELVNVVAVLPGTSKPESRIVIGGHYDSLNLLASVTGGDGAGDATTNEKTIDAPAPGVGDDASGVAVVMELARVLSRRQFEKTLVFVAFQGEEIGLVGSTLFAQDARKNNVPIEAMLNNDIVGTDVADNGRAEDGYVHVFSAEPADSLSRTLARYVRETAARYVPGFRAEPVFRADRFTRGGDHTPFAQNGYAAVRFTTPAENLGIQHTDKDTFEKTSPAYAAKVAQVNAAAAASLASAPLAPVVVREVATGPNKGRTNPMLARGASRVDAVLRWKDENPAADLAGYVVVVRSTTAPFWEQEIAVGKVAEYTLAGVNIDAVVLGVKAVDKSGNESLVSVYTVNEYPRAQIELQ